MERFLCNSRLEVPVTHAWGLWHGVVSGTVMGPPPGLPDGWKMEDVTLSYCSFVVRQMPCTKSVANQADPKLWTDCRWTVGVSPAPRAQRRPRLLGSQRKQKLFQQLLVRRGLLFVCCVARRREDDLTVSWTCPPWQRFNLARQDCG